MKSDQRSFNLGGKFVHQVKIKKLQLTLDEEKVELSAPLSVMDR